MSVRTVQDLIYLDHAALTPMHPSIADEMNRAVVRHWGHPSAVHGAGRRARARLEEASDQVARLLGCSGGQIEWYSSGTEALTEAIRTTALLANGPVISTRIEHPNLIEHVEALGATGRTLCWLSAPAGEPDPAAPTAAASAGDAIAIFSPLNHEMGTAPAAWARALPADAGWSIVDAVQAGAWLDLAPFLTDKSWVVIASHKLGGPPGAAALRVPPAVDRRRVPAAGPGGMTPWLAAVGMGAACELRRAALPAATAAVRTRAGALLRAMQTVVPALRRNGGESWLGPILSVSIPGVPGRALETALDLRNVCISRTAACRQGTSELAQAVAAAYPDEPTRAREATRWSLGIDTTSEELDRALEAFRDALSGLLPNGTPL